MARAGDVMAQPWDIVPGVVQKVSRINDSGYQSCQWTLGSILLAEADRTVKPWPDQGQSVEPSDWTLRFFAGQRLALVEFHPDVHSCAQRVAYMLGRDLHDPNGKA